MTPPRRTFVIALCFVALAACSPEESAARRSEINSALPPGCKMYDMGEYANLRRVVAVICDGRRTSATSERWSSGKTSAYGAVVTIEAE